MEEIQEQTKVCRTCKEEKKISDFSKQSYGYSHYNDCKECRVEIQKSRNNKGYAPGMFNPRENIAWWLRN